MLYETEIEENHENLFSIKNTKKKNIFTDRLMKIYEILPLLVKKKKIHTGSKVNKTCWSKEKLFKSDEHEFVKANAIAPKGSIPYNRKLQRIYLSIKVSLKFLLQILVQNFSISQA